LHVARVSRSRRSDVSGKYCRHRPDRVGPAGNWRKRGVHQRVPAWGAGTSTPNPNDGGCGNHFEQEFPRPFRLSSWLAATPSCLASWTASIDAAPRARWWAAPECRAINAWGPLPASPCQPS